MLEDIQLYYSNAFLTHEAYYIFDGAPQVSSRVSLPRLCNSRWTRDPSLLLYHAIRFQEGNQIEMLKTIIESVLQSVFGYFARVTKIGIKKQIL